MGPNSFGKSASRSSQLILESRTGLDATLRFFPTSEYRRFRADRMHYVLPNKLQRFDLYRDFGLIAEGLGEMGSPLSLTLRGNRPEEEAEVYWGSATPATVKKIYKALKKVSDDALMECIQVWLKSKNLSALTRHEKRRSLAAFQVPKGAYQTASRKGAYLMISIS